MITSPKTPNQLVKQVDSLENKTLSDMAIAGNGINIANEPTNNCDIVGSNVTISSDGVASGFSGNSYLTSQDLLTKRSNEDILTGFELSLKYTTPSDFSLYNGSLYYAESDDGYESCDVMIQDDGRLWFVIMSPAHDSTSVSSQALDTNTTYWLKFTWNTNDKCLIGVSTNGTNYTWYESDYELDCMAPSETICQIGRGMGGSLDLSECSALVYTTTATEHWDYFTNKQAISSTVEEVGAGKGLEESYIIENFNKINGATVSNEGIANSGSFTYDKYLTVDENIIASSTYGFRIREFEIQAVITSGNSLPAGAIFTTTLYNGVYEGYKGMDLTTGYSGAGPANGNLRFRLSLSSGTILTLETGSNTLSSNSTYYIKITYKSSVGYHLYVATDKNYTNIVGEDESSTKSTPDLDRAIPGLIIGYSSYEHGLNGLIDLSKTYMKLKDSYSNTYEWKAWEKSPIKVLNTELNDFRAVKNLSLCNSTYNYLSNLEIRTNNGSSSHVKGYSNILIDTSYVPEQGNNNKP